MPIALANRAAPGRSRRARSKAVTSARRPCDLPSGRQRSERPVASILHPRRSERSDPRGLRCRHVLAVSAPSRRGRRDALFLRKMADAAGRLVLVNDLVRGRVGYRAGLGGLPLLEPVADRATRRAGLGRRCVHAWPKSASWRSVRAWMA